MENSHLCSFPISAVLSSGLLTALFRSYVFDTASLSSRSPLHRIQNKLPDTPSCSLPQYTLLTDTAYTHVPSPLNCQHISFHKCFPTCNFSSVPPLTHSQNTLHIFQFVCHTHKLWVSSHPQIEAAAQWALQSFHLYLCTQGTSFVHVYKYLKDKVTPCTGSSWQEIVHELQLPRKVHGRRTEQSAFLSNSKKQVLVGEPVFGILQIFVELNKSCDVCFFSTQCCDYNIKCFV